jgi:undecaprenyl-diphosphatase
MNWFEAIFLGIVQGFTEFLPISSTAHVRVVPALLGWADPGAAFTAVIQLGTLLAIFFYFWGDLVRAFRGWVLGLRGGAAAQTPESRLGWAVIVGTIPIVILGVLLASRIREQFRSLYVISAMLIALALVLWFAEWVARHARGLDSVGLLDGAIVGLWQALALVPGVSRSGSTITGALFQGFDRATAARFSFLLSMPAVLLAAVHEIYDQRAALLEVGVFHVFLSTFAAFVSGYIAIDFLLRYLRTHTTLVFIIYRIALGLALLALIFSGHLDPSA